MILDDIIEKKKIQLEAEMKEISIEGWKRKIKGPGLHAVQDFYSALKRKDQLSIIAEVKKASPSKGLIKEDFNPVEIAREYLDAKVQAVSVLTERDFFKGSDEYLVKVRQSIPIPILRKDFIIDIWQIYQARCLGADAILLIAAVLTDDELKKFQAVATILGLHCLVEIHDREELTRVIDIGAKIIGINNRNLKTFEVDLKTTESLMKHIPHDRVVISESGIKSFEDMEYLKKLGVDAVLIGETFMRAPSIIGKINELRGQGNA